jgi:hypothetical protein
MYFDYCLPFHGDVKNPSIRGFESGHFLFAGSEPVALGLSKHWSRTLADQFPGRWLLALAVKIDMQETVPSHVAIAAGCGGKAILLINGEFRQRQHDAQSATTFCMTVQSRPGCAKIWR